MSKVYCNNCKHYKFDFRSVKFITGTILFTIGLLIGIVPVVMQKQLDSTVGILGAICLLIAMSLFMTIKEDCSLKKTKKEVIEDYEGKYVNEYVLIASELNEKNDCKYYEAK